MKKKTPETDPNNQAEDQTNEPAGYPLYPPNEDIYSRFKEEKDIDPEDLSRLKETDPESIDELDPDHIEELDPESGILPTDLDIPGADLDDEDEEIGREDEENNYYSIGGDNHVDLEEDQGDWPIEE